MGYGHDAVQDRRIRALEGKLEVLTTFLAELLMPAKFDELYSKIHKVEDSIMDEDSEC